jgi:hypothetical protein
MGDMRDAYTCWSENTESKSPLARSRCRWDVTVKIDVNGVGCELD